MLRGAGLARSPFHYGLRLADAYLPRVVLSRGHVYLHVGEPVLSACITTLSKTILGESELPVFAHHSAIIDSASDSFYLDPRAQADCALVGHAQPRRGHPGPAAPRISYGQDAGR